MINFVIIGIGEWEKYTKPLIDSIQKYEPDCGIVLVDNGSPEPYPITEGVKIIRFCKTISYPAGINAGMADPADWNIVINNDVIIKRHFTDDLLKLDPLKLYGFWTHEIFGEKYLSSWAYLLSRDVWNWVGGFDEAFTPMWLEDADYCIRLRRAGLEQVELDREEWGIIHLAQERGQDRKQFMDKHAVSIERNEKYLRRKHGI